MFRERLQGISSVLECSVRDNEVSIEILRLSPPLRLFGLRSYLHCAGSGRAACSTGLQYRISVTEVLILVSPLRVNTGPQKPLPATLTMREGEIMSLDYNQHFLALDDPPCYAHAHPHET